MHYTTEYKYSIIKQITNNFNSILNKTNLYFIYLLIFLIYIAIIYHHRHIYWTDSLIPLFIICWVFEPKSHRLLILIQKKQQIIESYNLINSRCYTLPCHLLSKLYSYIHRVTEPYCTICNNQKSFCSEV